MINTLTIEQVNDLKRLVHNLIVADKTGEIEYDHQPFYDILGYLESVLEFPIVDRIQVPEDEKDITYLEVGFRVGGKVFIDLINGSITKIDEVNVCF